MDYPVSQCKHPPPAQVNKGLWKASTKIPDSQLIVSSESLIEEEMLKLIT